MEKLRLVRGARLLQWLEETPFANLERGTMNFQPQAKPSARQNATGPIQIQKMEMVPAINSGNLTIKAFAKSDSGNAYSPTIQFDDIEFQEEDTPTNVTFNAVDNKDYHIDPIDLRTKNAKVHCNCLDFYWRFGKHNSRVNSLLGNPGAPYVKKNPNMPPANAQQTPGVCKHLLKVVEELRRNRIAS